MGLIDKSLGNDFHKRGGKLQMGLRKESRTVKRGADSVGTTSDFLIAEIGRSPDVYKEKTTVIQTWER